MDGGPRWTLRPRCELQQKGPRWSWRPYRGQARRSEGGDCGGRVAEIKVTDAARLGERARHSRPRRSSLTATCSGSQVTCTAMRKPAIPASVIRNSGARNRAQRATRGDTRRESLKRLPNERATSAADWRPLKASSNRTSLLPGKGVLNVPVLKDRYAACVWPADTRGRTQARATFARWRGLSGPVRRTGLEPVTND